MSLNNEDKKYILFFFGGWIIFGIFAAVFYLTDININDVFYLLLIPVFYMIHLTFNKKSSKKKYRMGYSNQFASEKFLYYFFMIFFGLVVVFGTIGSLTNNSWGYCLDKCTEEGVCGNSVSKGKSKECENCIKDCQE